MNPLHEKAFKVLLIEDDEVDIESIYRAFNKISLPVEMYVAENGIEAIHKLYENSTMKHIKLVPDLIIMDINMPRMNGIEFLEMIRANAALDVTKIVIFTTSNNAKDKLAAEGLHVSGYLTKPIQIDDLAKICNHIKHKSIEEKND